MLPRLHQSLTICVVLFLLACFVAPSQARQGDAFSFQEGDCPFPPLDGVVCGYLTVPEDRSQPDGSVVELAVAIIDPISDNPDPIPVVYLEGGPGGAPLLDTDVFLKHPVIEEHTLILFDQRGTGFSLPSLNCPELEADEDSDPVQACRDRLASEGVDLQMYNSAASAADVYDLTAALGYDTVHLWGVSYGTKLGLTILRDYPEIVESAVLDSVYAPETDDLEIQTTGVLDALNELFSRCADDAACSEAYPDLEFDFYAMLDALDANPVSIETDDGTVDLDGATVFNALFQTLYNTQALPYLPYGIELLANAETEEDYIDGYDILSDARLPDVDPPEDSAAPLAESDQVQEYMDEYGQIDDSEGMAYSVDCQEEYQLNDADADLALAADAPAPLDSYITDGINSNLQDCRIWDVQTADGIEAERVTSSVPTLLFAGMFDPITPVSSAESALQGLSEGQLLVFPSAGHGITATDTDSGACAKDLMLDFLDDPSAPLDTQCIAATGSIDFYIG